MVIICDNSHPSDSTCARLTGHIWLTVSGTSLIIPLGSAGSRSLTVSYGVNFVLLYLMSLHKTVIHVKARTELVILFVYKLLHS